MRVSSVADCRTLPELLRYRADLHPTRVAAIFVDDDGQESSLTYGEFWQRSRAVAHALEQLALEHLALDRNRSRDEAAPRAMLVFPPGLDFLPAFIGTQVAGWIPVPTCYPKPHRAMPRVNSVSRDCAPSVILSIDDTIAKISRRHLDATAAALPMLGIDGLGTLGADQHDAASVVEPDDIALLQYTSGSTSEPKGVIVSQRNVMANLASIVKGFHLQCDDSSSSSAPTAASWLPFFHDMGLIGGVLAPIYAGYRSVFISPQSFVQRPIRWLKLISDYQAIASGGPNFAYELCADRIAPSQMDSLDLRHLQVAFCGAEPIHPRTLHQFTQRFSSVGFNSNSFYPCYGLAEATLLAAGGDGPSAAHVIEVNRNALRSSSIEEVSSRNKRDGISFVSCGTAASGTTLKIVDPETSRELPELSVGEIWLQGESITRGYWNRPEENAQRFGILDNTVQQPTVSRWLRRLSAKPVATDASADDTYFRTGDLGFIRQGQLFVTGRIKDIVIIRGRNYAPQDIEVSVMNANERLQGRCVAFSVDGPRSEGLAVIAEILRDTPESSLPEIARDIRRAVIDEHEVDPRLVLLVRPGAIPVTTSGKVQRSACRDALRDGRIEPRYRWERSGGAESPPLPIPKLPAVLAVGDQAEIESIVKTWLCQWLIARVGIDPAEIEMDRRFDDYGLDSLTAVELSGELEDWSGVELTPTNAWEHPTVTSMAELVASGLIENGTSVPCVASPLGANA
jgi:acyl-CoA synthetase (AMP-forming)/AMP-acid ligase II/acyl carrier protein